VLTYHQVQCYLQKTVALSNDLRKLKELLLPVLQIFESIDERNREMDVDRNIMRGEIRSVELLGEMLRQHVFQQPGACRSGKPFGDSGATAEAGLSDAAGRSEDWSAGPGDYVI